MTGAAPDLDALLAHAGWVEALSRQLCRDREAAADAAQETFLQALRSPPRAGGNPRGFLATLLRNTVRLRARTDQRRQRREQATARDGFAEAAADAVARAELHRFLVQQVLELPEPQRALVLLHYFEGASIAAVARRSGFTAEAVRAHLRRARQTLRGRLRGSDGPVRRGYALVLLQARGLFVPFTLMALGMKKIAVSVAAAAAVALLVWQVAAPPPPAAPPPLTPLATAPAAAALAPPAATDDRRDAEQRIAVDVPAAEREVRCRLVGLHRDAKWTAPVKVDLEGKDEPADTWLDDYQQHVPDADGAFTIRLPAWTATCVSFEARFRADDPLYLEFDTREKEPSLAATRLAHADVYELEVQVVSVLTGKVVDARGDGVPAARVCALPWQDDSPASQPRPQTNTAADGSFRLLVPMATEVVVVAIPMQEASLSGMRMTGRHGAIADCNQLRPDLLAASVRAVSRFGSSVDVGTLVLPAAAAIRGVVRAGGRPLPDVEVDWFADSYSSVYLDHLWISVQSNGQVVHAQQGQTAQQRCTTDAEGRFALPAPPGVPGWCMLTKRLQRFERLIEPRSVIAPAEVVFDLAPPIVVRVLRGEVPVEPASVVLEPFTNETYATDKNGEVRLLREHAQPQKLKVLVPGEPAVVLEAPADASPDQPLVVQIEERPQVKIALEVEGDFRVRQIEGSLQPLDRQAYALGFARFRNDGTGPFELQAPPGRYRLHLRAPRRAERRDTFLCRLQQEVEIGPGPTALHVRTRHGGRIGLDLRDAAGLLVRANVRLVGPDGRESAPGFWTENGGVSQPGNAAGNAETYENLVPGRYELVLDLGAHGTHRRTVEVQACEVATVRIVVP